MPCEIFASILTIVNEHFVPYWYTIHGKKDGRLLFVETAMSADLSRNVWQYCRQEGMRG